jgi:hypothetical protein
MKVTIQHHLVLRLRIIESVSVLALYAVMVCSGMALSLSIIENEVKCLLQNLLLHSKMCLPALGITS